MTLAVMLSTDEESLICDFAETYHIFNYKELPLETVALLACGLRDDSRIKMKLSNLEVKPISILLASIIDELKILVWMKTTDGAKGRNRPKSLVATLTKKETGSSNIIAFNTPEEFEKERQRIIERGKG